MSQNAENVKSDVLDRRKRDVRARTCSRNPDYSVLAATPYRFRCVVVEDEVAGRRAHHQVEASPSIELTRVHIKDREIYWRIFIIQIAVKPRTCRSTMTVAA